jgi:GTP-binding protein
VIDVMPVDGSDPLENAKVIINELENHSPVLAAKPRWLVFNKLDLLLEEEAKELTDSIIAGLDWKGESISISAVNKMGTEELSRDVMAFIDSLPDEVEEEVLDGKNVEFKWDSYHDEAISGLEDDLDDEDWDEDEYDVEVEYRK